MAALANNPRFTDHHAKGARDVSKLPKRAQEYPVSYDDLIRDFARKYEQRYMRAHPDANSTDVYLEYYNGLKDTLYKSDFAYAVFEYRGDGQYQQSTPKSPVFTSESQARHWLNTNLTKDEQYYGGKEGRGYVVRDARKENPARSAEQYGLAQAILSGTARTSSMPVSVARKIVEETPERKRQEYAKELAEKRQNPMEKGDWVSWTYRDNRGTLRALTGKVTYVGDNGVIFKSDGGQPGFPRGKTVGPVPYSEIKLSDSPYAPHHKRGNPVRTFSSKSTADAYKRLVEGEGKRAEVRKSIDGWEVHFTGARNSGGGYVVYPSGNGFQSIAVAKKHAKELSMEGDGRARVERVDDEKVVARYQDGRDVYGKQNPEDAAAEMYASFHGTPSEEVLEFEEDELYHGHLSELGILCEMKVVTLSGYKVDLCFSQGDEEEEDEDGTEKNPADLHAKLAHTVTKYDMQQQGKRGYNMYALPQYLGAVQRVDAEVAGGKSVRSALVSNFNGRLLDRLLKAVGETTSTREEQRFGNPSDRITHRGNRFEVWKGNDNEGRLGFDPWFFRLISGSCVSRINWHVLGPDKSREAAVASAKYAIDRCMDARRNPESDPINSSTTLLCSNEDGNQLYLLGGDQSLNLEDIHMDGDWERDSMVIGVLCELTYRTEKSFDKFQLTDYYHRLGEETSDEPMLRYDRMNEKLFVDGGKYRIEKPLVGVSPGLEN